MSGVVTCVRCGETRMVKQPHRASEKCRSCASKDARPVTDPICRLEGCDKPREPRYTLCSMHNARKQRHGDVNYRSNMSFDTPLIERIEAFITITVDGCWEWKSLNKRSGYGHIQLGPRANQTTPIAHRVVYEYLVEPIPEGLTLDHLCHNRPCVNPDHLEPVTAVENWRRSNMDPRMVAHRLNQCTRGHEITPENSIKQGPRRPRCKTCADARKARLKDTA